MNSLYLEHSTMGSLFRFFSRYFSKATRPTQFLLTWLVIASWPCSRSHRCAFFTGIFYPR